MRNILKIIIGITLLFLLIGYVAAACPDSIKPLEDYTDFDANGYSNYTTNSNRYFLVEKISSFDDDFKNEWFENHTEWEFTVIPIEDDIFYAEDDNFGFYCYQEVVNIDGDYYMVSINQNSHLSPSEKNLYLKDLKEFNKLNNLEPVAV